MRQPGPVAFLQPSPCMNGVQADWEKHEMDTWEGKGWLVEQAITFFNWANA